MSAAGTAGITQAEKQTHRVSPEDKAVQLLLLLRHLMLSRHSELSMDSVTCNNHYQRKSVSTYNSDDDTLISQRGVTLWRLSGRGC